MDIKRFDTGIHTVEGAVSGSRAARLTKEREKQMEQYNALKEEIQAKKQSVSAFGSKFSAASSGAEAALRSRTVGLLTADEYAAAVEHAAGALALASSGGGSAGKPSTTAQQAEALPNNDVNTKTGSIPQSKGRGMEPAAATAKKRVRTAAVLSFNMDEENEENEENEDGGGGAGGGGVGAKDVSFRFPGKKAKKDPNAATSFLPDRERDAALEKAKEALRQEWLIEQEQVKSQKLEVVYSYWDGSGHRRTLTITKGATIEEFLIAVKQQCQEEFRDLRTCSADSLMYVKEDLVIPHHLSFYDLIVTKARGKSGPLFHFDVHDDIRLRSDATVEKDESHPGKICQRSWYERNKHIFPASRWEVYDPAVKREKYTIHGK